MYDETCDAKTTFPTMDAAMCALNLHSAPQDVITAVLATMGLKQRFTCALVCRAWAKAAAAATRALDLHEEEDIRGLQQWLEKYGNQLEFLRLCTRRQGNLTTLPCAQLHDLQLGGCAQLSVGSRVWSDVAAATKLTSVTLEDLHTESTPAEVLSVLACLPDLKQLMLGRVAYSDQYWGLDEAGSLMLQQLTQITHLWVSRVQPSTLQDIVMLGQLRSLVMTFAPTFNSLPPPPWPSINRSEVPGLTALTNLELFGYPGIPPAISQMTALQQLEADEVKAAALHQLSMLPGLTRIQMRIAPSYSPESAPPQLPAMQEIVWFAETPRQAPDCLSMSFFDGCTQLQKLVLVEFHLSLRPDRPGSWVASSTLQHLDLGSCSIVAAEGDAGPPVCWQQVFTPGQMSQLTSLRLPCGPTTPPLSLADGHCMVDCCSRLQVLTGVSPDILPALVTLPQLTYLGLTALGDSQCSSLVQLTGLQGFHVEMAADLTTAGLRQLAGLQQLTSINLKLHPNIRAPQSAVPILGSLMSTLISDAPKYGHLILFNEVRTVALKFSKSQSECSTAVVPRVAMLPTQSRLDTVNSHVNILQVCIAPSTANGRLWHCRT